MTSDDPRAFSALSAREQEVLRLMGAGYSNAEIAAYLSLSLGTVKWYNTHIFQKLGVRSRAQAIARLHDSAPVRLEHDSARASGDLSFAAPEEGLAFPGLPGQPTPFIGREDELRRVAFLLGDPACRMLTFVGPGGIGKTRLALEAANREGARFRHGAWFVPLASLPDPDEIDCAIASVLEIPLGGGVGDVDVRRRLLDFLKPRQLLLILDNFDELLNGAGRLSELLQAAPGVKALVTSRERLNLQEETVIRVDGLPVADLDSDSDLTQASAATLFLVHVRRAQPDFALTSENKMHVARICRLVEGMPLGIILAAAWADVLSLSEIAEEIARSLDFLQADIRNLPERHRSIRGVFDSTWKLLGAAEREAFARLSIFCGGFTRTAAQEVALADLRTLTALVSKSLLIRREDGRFDMHELLRQYAEERLAELGEQPIVVAGHYAYYFDLLTAPENSQSDHDSVLDEDFDNIRLAWERAIEVKATDAIGAALERWREFCLRQRRYQEAVRAFDLAIDMIERYPESAGPALALRLRECRGSIRSLLGQFEGAVQDLQRVQEAAHQAGDFALERHALVQLGQVFRKTELYNEAHHALEEVVRQSRALSDQRALADAVYHLGTIAWDEGRANDAYQCHAEAVSICEALGNRDVVAVQAWHGLGEALLASAWPVRSTESFSTSLALAREAGDAGYESENLQMIAWSALGTVGTGDYATARTAFSESLAIADAAHLQWHRVCSLSGYGLAQAITGDFGPGLTMVLEAIDAAVSLGVTRFVCLALDCAGQLYQDLGSFDQASAFFRRGIDLSLRSESAFWLPRLQANEAITRLRQGDLNVEADLTEALELAIARGMEHHALRCREGLIELAMARGEYSQARSQAEALLALATERNLRELAVQARRWRGESLLMLNDLEHAERDLQQAAQLADGIGRVRLIMDVQRALARLYGARGDPKRALAHNERAQKISAAMQDVAA